MRRALVGLLLALACEKTKPARWDLSDKLAPGVVKLVDAGKDPKTPLRFHFRPGTHQTVTLGTSGAIDAGGEHHEIPPSTMTQELDVASVGDDGSAHLEGVFTKMDAPNGADSSMFRGLKVHMTVGADGKVSDMGTDGSNPMFDQIMAQVGKQLANPLPAEPVGVGARWRYVTQVDLQGIKMDMSAGYILESINGDRVVIGVTVEPKVDADALAAKMSPGGKMDFSGTGEGELTLDLSKPIPLATTMTMNLRFSARGGGDSMSGKMKMTMEMHGS